MSIQVYNTLTGRLEPFQPFSGDKANVYVCGPTVYDYSHIGHARTYLSFDIIIRYLEYKGYKVTYVVNITDIDDKIINRAKETHEDPLSLSKRFEQAFFEDMKGFHLRPANFYPRVSDHMQDIIAMVRDLIRKQFAYEVDGDVYFDVTKIRDFGKLSHQSLDQMMAGARVEIDRKKKSPYDFALWKHTGEDEPGWESPWGRGRPGWHIECSAMSMKYLGPQLDIHGGAKDLVFPHHENEIVQSESYTGKKPFVKYWIHTGFLTINGQKMSKSLGNFITIRDLLKKHSPESFRLFVLSTHYRRPVDFSEDGLIQAKATLERMYETRDRLDNLVKSHDYKESSPKDEERLLEEVSEAREKFLMGMDNDFNSAIALASFHHLIRLGNKIVDLKPSKKVIEIALNTINELGWVFGLFRQEKKGSVVSNDVKALIEERDKARKRRDWKKADEIRERLRKMGVTLRDSPDGTAIVVES
ncbi:cysteine--tRNA ligase [Candidatus Bathyarchaeota archaeon]|nr:cysteine--tRNA ligase [Candidatus Bathyarchaeota archaeon]